MDHQDAARQESPADNRARVPAKKRRSSFLREPKSPEEWNGRPNTLFSQLEITLSWMLDELAKLRLLVTDGSTEITGKDMVAWASAIDALREEIRATGATNSAKETKQDAPHWFKVSANWSQVGKVVYGWHDSLPMRGFNPKTPAMVRQLDRLDRLAVRAQTLIDSYKPGIAISKLMHEFEPKQQTAPRETAPSWSEVGSRISVAESDADQLAYMETLHPDLDPARLAAMGKIASAKRAVDEAQRVLDESVHDGREHGVTWADVGRLVQTTAESAMRRWDSEARRRHSDYRRKKD